MQHAARTAFRMVGSAALCRLQVLQDGRYVGAARAVLGADALTLLGEPVLWRMQV